MKTIALIGNPNCGKTTFFNALTGSHQKVGNWSGVTTEEKEGVYKKNKNVKIVDLPGIYSFSASGKDEQAVLKYLKENPPDYIINVVDGVNLPRNLYLTSLLSHLGVPTVLAVNFADELKKNKIAVDFGKLSEKTGVPVVDVSAKTGQNVDKTVEIALSLKGNEVPFIGKENLTTKERYEFIEKTLSGVFFRKQTVAEKFTLKADNFFTGKYTGILFFIFVLTAVYFLSLKIGGYFSEYLGKYFSLTESNVRKLLENGYVPLFLIDLICGAVLKGVGTVLSFLPQILVLFFLLAILEESGYMARVSFILDRIFKWVGLGGKSVIPLIVSCGCSATGIMSARTVESEKERKSTVFLSPFMPCGAKMAVFGWFSQVFFNGSALIATSMYLLSIVVIIVCGLLLKNKDKTESVFALEIPVLRFPGIKDVLFVLYEKIKEFLIKSGTVIFLVSVVLWALKSFGLSGYVGQEIDKSFLRLIGDGIKWIFYPLGFYDWRASVAIISGVFAKEAVVETFELIGGYKDIFISGFAVYSFMAFVLLSPPCLASLLQAKRELKNRKDFLFMIIFQFLTAYTVSLAVNLLGILILNIKYLIFTTVVVIIIAVLTVLSVRLFKKCNKNCLKCKEREKCKSL